MIVKSEAWGFKGVCNVGFSLRYKPLLAWGFKGVSFLGKA